MNDGWVRAEGYCRDCPGHDTKEGAYEHQTQYMIDHASFDGQWAETQYRCQADVPPDNEKCGQWTDRFASVGNRTYNLCDVHRTRETVMALYDSVGDSFGSC